MRNKLDDTLVEFVVQLINAIWVLLCNFFRICDFGCDNGMLEKGGSYITTHVRILGNDLCDDITRSSISFQARLHTLFCIQERLSMFLKDSISVSFQFRLLQYEFSQRCKAFLTGNTGTSFTFGAI